MRTTRILATISAAVLMAALLGGAVAGQTDDEVMSSTDDEAAMMEGDALGVANLRLVDSTGSGDSLVGASSPSAAAVELDLAQVGEDGGFASVPVDFITIPADGELVLQTSAYHLVLIDPDPALAAGDEIELTLDLSNAGSVTLTTPVVTLDAAALTPVAEATEAPDTPALPTTITVEALDNFFVPDTLEAPANTEVKVVLKNYGFLPHNIAFYTDESATQLLAEGSLTSVIDPETEAIARFTTPGPGEYFILCVIHPEMTGTFIVR